MKTKDQRKFLRENKMIPCLWVMITDNERWMTVMNWLTGTFRVLEK
jgi:hypothetical protein